MIKKLPGCAVLLCIALLTGVIGLPTQAGGREYTGSIGPCKVRMKLSRSGADALAGTYVYDQVGKDIRVAGKVDSAGNITLDELDEKGAVTATLEGEFYTPHWIAGTWTSKKDKKSLTFSAWQPDADDIPVSDPGDKISGKYQRIDHGRIDKNTSDLDVNLLKDGTLSFRGLAFWVGNPKTGDVNLGGATGVAHLKDGKWIYKESDDESSCRINLEFGPGSAKVEDNNNCGGMNVTFSGDYRKAVAARPRKRA